MSTMVVQITSFAVVYLTVCSGADQRKYESSASLASVRGIHRWPTKSPHKGPVTRKMFQFDDVIMAEKWLLSIFLRLSTLVNLFIDKRILNTLPRMIYVSYGANSSSVDKTQSSVFFIYCDNRTILEDTLKPGKVGLKLYIRLWFDNEVSS